MEYKGEGHVGWLGNGPAKGSKPMDSLEQCMQGGVGTGSDTSTYEQYSAYNSKQVSGKAHGHSIKTTLPENKTHHNDFHSHISSPPLPEECMVGYRGNL
eukprot:1151876-Pelagomonas_calceolata.AAC.4